jgi:murein DD-endopeptidase MepM/ murein hydrolase activator NlpD
MPAFIRPTSTSNISDDFADHAARGSVNPGVDYVVGTGTPVVAVADGVVSGVTTSIAGAGGRMVWLDFANGYNCDYLHLSRVDVAKGQTVKQGQVLGLSGGSGRGSEKGYGAHLHFSFRAGGGHVQGRGNIDYEAFPCKLQSAAGVAPAAKRTQGSQGSAPAARPTVKKGSKGPDVMSTCSRRLVRQQTETSAHNTHKAVVAFQTSKGLVADGIVGPNTWKAIG